MISLQLRSVGCLLCVVRLYVRMHSPSLLSFLVTVFYFLVLPLPTFSFFFFFNDTATTEIYTLSLHDALPIYFAADDLPAGDHHQHGDEAVQQDEQDRNAVHAEVIVHVEAGDPGRELDELHEIGRAHV